MDNVMIILVKFYYLAQYQWKFLGILEVLGRFTFQSIVEIGTNLEFFGDFGHSVKFWKLMPTLKKFKHFCQFGHFLRFHQF